MAAVAGLRSCGPHKARCRSALGRCDSCAGASHSVSEPISLRVVPANAGTHSPWRRGLHKGIRPNAKKR